MGDDDETTKNITIADIRLRTGASSTRTFSVSRPPNAKIQELEFSPQGDRIAWLVKQDTISTPMKSLNGKLDQNKADMHPTIGIWVCRLNGTRMHEIGHLPMIDEAAKDAPDDTNSPNPENVQWLPDGRRLSFVYRGALYTVPAD